MCKFIGKSNERILSKLSKSKILRLYSIVHVAMETTKRHILPANQNLSSVYFSLARFQLVSCNLSLALTWQMTYTHKLPKLCSTTLTCKGRFRCTKITVCRLLRLREEFYEFLACEQALRGAYWHAWRWGGELAHGLFKSSTPI